MGFLTHANGGTQMASLIFLLSYYLHHLTVKLRFTPFSRRVLPALTLGCILQVPVPLLCPGPKFSHLRVAEP